MDNLDVKIEALQEQGMSIRGISREVGLSHVAIMKRLKKIKAGGNQAQNHHPITDTQTGNLTGNLTNQDGNQQGMANSNPSSLQQYRPKDLCKLPDCAVCALPIDKFHLLKDLYINGTPMPVLSSYFNLKARDIADHAYHRNWHKLKAKWEDPRRKKAIQEALENELWKTIMSSEAGGDARDRIQALKLAAQVRGLIETGPKIGLSLNWEQRLAGMGQGQKQLEGRQEAIEIDFEESPIPE